MNKIRRILSFVLLVTVLVNLTGCRIYLGYRDKEIVTLQEKGADTVTGIGKGLGSKRANEVEETKKSGTLRMQVFTNESEAHSSAWTNVVTAFEEATGISVTLIMGSQVNTQYSAAWLAGEVPADIVWIAGNGIPDDEMEASGMFYDLKDTLTNATIYGTDMKISDKLNMDVIRELDGHMYRAPLMNSVQGLWYDSRYVKKAPTNYDEFVSVSKELKKQGMAGLTYPGMYADYNTWALIMPAVAAYGEDFFNEVASGNPDSFLDERFQSVLTRYKKYCDAGYLLKGSTSADHTTSQLNWLNSKAGFITNGLWLEAEMQDYIPADFQMTFCTSPLVEKGQKQVIVRQSNNLAVAAGSENLDNALEFIRFMYRDDVQLEFMGKYSYLSALKELDYTDAELTDVARSTMAYIESGEADTINYHVNWNSLINNTFKQVINDISAGTMTVEEGCRLLYEDAKR